MSDVGPGDKVRLYVSDELIRVGPEATVRQMARRLAAEGVGALVVVEGDQVHGIVSERDLMQAIAEGQDWTRPPPPIWITGMWSPARQIPPSTTRPCSWWSTTCDISWSATTPARSG
jgi:hypothetical protein